MIKFRSTKMAELIACILTCVQSRGIFNYILQFNDPAILPARLEQARFRSGEILSLSQALLSFSGKKLFDPIQKTHPTLPRRKIHEIIQLFETPLDFSEIKKIQISYRLGNQARSFLTNLVFELRQKYPELLLENSIQFHSGLGRYAFEDGPQFSLFEQQEGQLNPLAFGLSYHLNPGQKEVVSGFFGALTLA